MSERKLMGCCRCIGGTPELIITGRCKDLFYYECQECGNVCNKSATEFGALINWNHLQNELQRLNQEFWDTVENDEEFWLGVTQ